MIDFSYSTFGLTRLTFPEAIAAIGRAGYAGVELAFHRDQFNPFELTDADLDTIRDSLDRAGLAAPCLATASHFFNPQRPHEPSLLSTDLAGRKRRIDLIKRGIRVARALGVKLVTFGSGFRRDDHVRQPQLEPLDLLVESVRECLREIGDGDDITLLIEPEPGMLIETMEEATTLIDEMADPRFGLHIDICHAYCSEPDYIEALAQAASSARYLHISDARAGYNLKISSHDDDLDPDLAFASHLIHFPASSSFFLLDPHHPVLFTDQWPDAVLERQVTAHLRRAGLPLRWRTVNFDDLPHGRSSLDDEIFTYLISVPGLSFDVLERAHPVIAWLRGHDRPALVDRMVANTRTGIVHFHEIPGEGTLDLAASFRALEDNGFRGFGTVELYHHVESWQNALDASLRHLNAVSGRC
ncbi:MAG: sugar phosphate isomerase/epimerase [Xanthomonadales bacterium]|nr:sugar phosphate isomerase/epimerase [Xanthomonadales bacterium]